VKSRYVAPLGFGGYGTGPERLCKSWSDLDHHSIEATNVWVLVGAGCEYYFSPEEEDEEEGKQVVGSWSWVRASM